MVRLGVLFGGQSGEHEISLMSASSVINAIDREKYDLVKIGITKQGDWYLFDGPTEQIKDGSWEEYAKAALLKDPEKYGLNVLASGGKSLKEKIDFALPILHGPYGEDGTIQGIFEMVDIPYSGSGVTGSAVTMDKIIAKAICGKEGIPQGPYMAFTVDDFLHGSQAINELENNLSYPMFVKPANMGSSVGISKVRSRKELVKAVGEAGKYCRRILVEEGIDCRELEVGVLGNHDLEVSVVGEIIPSSEFYDYKAKYFDGGKSRLCIPAEIPRDKADEIRQIASKAYKLLDCSGFARVDFFMDKSTGKILLNEINSIPGFTKFSMFPLLWESQGVVYSDLVERIVRLGYERYNAENSG